MCARFIGLQMCGGIRTVAIMAKGQPPQPPSQLAPGRAFTGDDRGTPLPDHDQAFIRELVTTAAAACPRGCPGVR